MYNAARLFQQLKHIAAFGAHFEVSANVGNLSRDYISHFGIGAEIGRAHV